MYVLMLVLHMAGYNGGFNTVVFNNFKTMDECEYWRRKSLSTESNLQVVYSECR